MIRNVPHTTYSDIANYGSSLTRGSLQHLLETVVKTSLIDMTGLIACELRWHGWYARHDRCAPLPS